MGKGKSAFTVRIRELADNLIYLSIDGRFKQKEIDKIAWDLHQLADGLDEAWTILMDTAEGKTA